MIYFTFRLRLLLKYLEDRKSRTVSLAEMQSIISYSADVLNHCSTCIGIESSRYAQEYIYMYMYMYVSVFKCFTCGGAHYIHVHVCTTALNIVLRSCVISHDHHHRSTTIDELSAVQDKEVRGWLSSTFTRGPLKTKQRKRQSFRSVATSVMFGKFMES